MCDDNSKMQSGNGKSMDKGESSGPPAKFHCSFSKDDVSHVIARLIPGGASEITDAAHHQSLHGSAKDLKNLNFLSSLFYLKGGVKMKEALQGTPEEQRAAVDNIIASLVTDNIVQSQAVLRRIMCYTEIENEKELDILTKLLDLKAKCDSQVLRALEVKAKLTSLPGIKISNAGQVNIGGVQQVRNDGGQKVTDLPPKDPEGWST